MTGTLPIGIEHGGQIHRTFEVRARKVRDSIEATKDLDIAGDDSLLGLAILAKQVIAIGTIPPELITWQLLYEAWEDDLKEIDIKTREAADQLRTFSGNDEGGKKTNPDADEAGLHSA